MGVDLGTQSIKVIIYDFENKKIISTKSQSYELISKEDGSMEQQASWWIDGFEKCLENIDEVYGYHNIPNFDEGDIRVCEGPFFAAVTQVRIKVVG